jgi:hypothetical protein
VRLITANGEPSCRLFFGSIGFAIFIFLIVSVCILGYDGKDEHVDLIKNLGYICAGLLGLSAFDIKGLGGNKNRRGDDGDS